ncbi:hypothetical protein SNEBB_010208 [Seison nebaliae]|nr:hypothetical protein SNEBB_010208 [Seison nebaliae]
MYNICLEEYFIIFLASYFIVYVYLFLYYFQRRGKNNPLTDQVLGEILEDLESSHTTYNDASEMTLNPQVENSGLDARDINRRSTYVHTILEDDINLEKANSKMMVTKTEKIVYYPLIPDDMHHPGQNPVLRYDPAAIRKVRSNDEIRLTRVGPSLPSMLSASRTRLANTLNFFKKSKQ